MAVADPWHRLADGLGEADGRAHAGQARLGAALALVSEVGGDLEIVYTRRRDDLRTHPGQISFPGGRVDPGETVPEAAVREAEEEVGLDSVSVRVLGALPAFYIPPSRFWLQTVVAQWRRPHALQPAEREVAEIVRARVGQLVDPDRWRTVRVSSQGWSWAWQLDGEHLLWGATAMSTEALLDVLVPGWRGGTDPAALAPEREVRPWLAGRSRRRRPVVLEAVPTVPSDRAGTPWEPPATSGLVRAAAAGTAELVRAVGARRVAVLTGGGSNGAVGLATAALLAADGWEVTVVLDRDVARVPSVSTLGRDRLAVAVGALPSADVYVDALVGDGLSGPLARGGLDLVEQLRRRSDPVVAIDLPTGLDPQRGLVGDCVTATATLSLGGPRPGLLMPGLEPFVGDLYMVGDDGILRRVTRVEAPGWRE